MTAESDRIRTIITSPDGEVMGPLARYLAFEMTESAESSLEILAVARKCRDEMAAQQTTSAQTKAGWDAAVANVNSRH